MMNEKIMIAMSGGVDSAVSALLAGRGREAAGVTMQLSFTPGKHAEAAIKDIEDAKKTCGMLGIPHFVANLSDSFKEKVVKAFIKAYLDGKTPNPCIDCNKEIKFGALLHFAKEHGYDRIATGHYAQVERDANGRFLLRRAKDTAKDQSYVLYTLTQEMLSSVEFPLGTMSKCEVRELAAKNGFEAASRRESQDICFIPDGDYAKFIEDFGAVVPKPGAFLSPDGRVLGEHRGIIHYTIGQRKGLGIALGKPAFVVSKSAHDNTVTLGENENLFTRRLTITNLNFIPFDSVTSPLKLLAKARYRQEAAPARVEQTGKDEMIVEFDEPQRAVSPGQSLVLYDGDIVVGGGKIQ
ncbi:MAG: tRNA 2-thiouridine(34) synthase MnmA [Clostridia bacterium]|nr:tRNA 2-thiouridine(34) synthase MnmA [Clostridia bacterium]